MPLHITENYDGQLSGQGGIHSRYESKMVAAYLNNINVLIKKGVYITDVRSFVFDYLFANYTYVDSVLQSDTYAKTIAGSTSSTVYISELWKKTGNFTGHLFTEAAYSLSSLIYTAWYEAEHPVSILWNQEIVSNVLVNNPVHQFLYLKINPSQSDQGVKVELISLDMRVDTVLYNNIKSKGNQHIDLQIPEFPAGVYLLRITTGTRISIKKIIIF